MTIYEMNKEQIIDTAKEIADKVGCNLLGLWSNLNDCYRQTIILIDDSNQSAYEELAYKVYNGLADVDGNIKMTSHELYITGYESCELDITVDREYFNDILEIGAGVNWVE